MTQFADRPKWPHLENMSSVLKVAPDYLDAREGTRWTVTEKVHGFNARFGVDASGVAWCGSRNTVTHEGDPESWNGADLQGFVRFASDQLRKALIANGDTIFGEWAGKGVQKGIDYGDKDFYAFGLMSTQAGLEPFSEVQYYASVLGFKTVPVILRGWEYAPSVEGLQELRDQPSRIAPQHGEGVVVFPYPPILGPYGNPLIMKVKAPSFEERTRFANPDKGKSIAELAPGAEAFAVEYATANRLDHVLQQVAESFGDDPLDVTLTGEVMRGMVEDCIREGQADYDALTEGEQRLVGKAINQLTKQHLTAARDAAIMTA
jgi:hypothetical protein